MSEGHKARAARADSPKPTAKPGDGKMSDDDRAKAIDRIKNKRLVIPEEGLKRIAEHKYKAGVYTPIDNFMNTYFWTPCVAFIPTWIAPNLVTVTGLVVQIIGFLTLSYYCPDFKATAPRWVYLFAAFTVFVYQTMDALDGKQARRTGSSSPLGQLFDHGCDSVVLIFLSMLTAMVLHLGFSVRCVSFIVCMLFPFWLCQWTEYHIHSLPTSIAGIIGVTEAQLISMLLAAGNVYDTAIWNHSLGIGTLPAWWCGSEACPIALCDVVVIVNISLTVIGTVHCFYSAIPAVSNKGEALMQTTPVFMLAIVGYAWCIMIPHAHPRLVIFTLGVSFSHMTCKMIVAAMAHIEYPIFQPVLAPLPIIFVISKLQISSRHDDILLGMYTAISVYSMCKWVRSAIEEISQYIGIHTFRLGPRAKPKA